MPFEANLPIQEDKHPRDEQILDQIKRQAAKGDVTHKIHTSRFRPRLIAGDPKILDIQRQGHESDAIKWLKSALPEGMKFGPYPRAKRLAKARECANLAGTTIEDLAQEHGIELLE